MSSGEVTGSYEPPFQNHESSLKTRHLESSGNNFLGAIEMASNEIERVVGFRLSSHKWLELHGEFYI
jgi:hypothetical protein